MVQPDQSAEPVGTRRNIRDKGMDRRFWRNDRSCRFSLLPSIDKSGDKRCVGMVAEIALAAAGAIQILRIGRRRSLFAHVRDFGFQAAAIRRRQGGLDRKQEQKQDNEDAPEIHVGEL